MSNRALALASLVMAIPAGLACYVCVDSIFKNGENAPGVMVGILWTLVILCGLLAISPIVFLLRKGSAPTPAPVAAAPTEAEPAKKPAKAASDDDEFGSSDDDGGEDDSSADSEQLFDEEDAVADDDFDDNFDFDEEPEEEAPKKKKKK